jgi:cytoskeletal protein RodZ
MTGLGEYLRKERERKSLSIEDVAEITNINPKLLQAMEKGDFRDIPGVFYAKNFLKTYLQAVEADQEEFFKTFQPEIDRILDEKRDDPAQYYSKLRYSSFKKRNLYLISALILLLIVSVFCFFYQSKDNLFQVIDFNSPQPDKSPRTYLDRNFLDKVIVNDWSFDYSPINVKLVFNEKSWIQVLRGGRKVVSSVFQPGDIREFHGYRLNITLGNPSGLRLYLNETEVTRFQNQKRSVRIQLDLAKLEELVAND